MTAGEIVSGLATASWVALLGTGVLTGTICHNFIHICFARKELWVVPVCNCYLLSDTMISCIMHCQ